MMSSLVPITFFCNDRKGAEKSFLRGRFSTTMTSVRELSSLCASAPLRSKASKKR